MAVSQDLEELQCVTAFQQGNHEQAVQLLPLLNYPAAVTTRVNISGRQEIPPNKDVTLLHLAAYHGWLDVIMVLQELVFEYNCRDSEGLTPLHYAASSVNCLKVVDYLIRKLGCDPNAKTKRQNLPLHVACLHGRLNAVKYFITEQNCKPNAQGNNKYSPLHFAASAGHMDIIQYLITEHGCDPKTTNNYGNLPLHLACANGHLLVAKYFINEQKCDPNIRNLYGTPPLHYASEGGHIDIIHYLITEQGCDPTIPDTNGSLPLHIACSNGHLKATQYFIAKECDPTSQGHDGYTPLHYASEGGHMNIIHYLITEIGCDPSIPDTNGRLPLHVACGNGHLDAAKYFITKQNCDPNLLNFNGYTPLHYASEGGHVDIIHFLITELGCDPMAMDYSGNLSLHIACLNGQLNVARYLIIKKHCNPICRGHNGYTPLHYASLGGHINIIRYLITVQRCKRYAPDDNGDLPLHIASRHGHLNAVKYLITDSTYDLRCGIHKSTPLHYATEGGHLNIVKYLITELGCDPTIPNGLFLIPLHIACLHGHFDIVKFLITDKSHDSKCFGLNINGSTPLHYAAQGGHLNIIQHLITEVGCDPSIIDHDNRTLLHWASHYGHNHVVQWLLRNTHVDILAKDKKGNTCIDLAKHRYEILKMFQPLIDSSRHFPIHKLGKIILTGNSATGKTTLAKVIDKRAAKQSINWLDSLKKVEVTSLTAGIVLFQNDSKEAGSMVLYDLAGQTEYHSSHLAIMEVVMQQSPATFINVIDLSNDYVQIEKDLHYWLNFINNATYRTTNRSCLIVVGSHADLLNKKEIENKSTFIDNVVESRISRLDFKGFVAVDCRKIESKGTQYFVSLLCQSQLTVSSRTPSISYYCHILYEFLQSKPEMPYCTLDVLILLVTSQECPIPTDSTFFTRILTALNDKGLIIFLRNQQKVNESWIIVDIEIILKNINGKIFGEAKSKEKAVTGIISSSTLKQLFPQYDHEMVVGFLQSLELCHCINLSSIKTNLQISSQSDIENCFFFPSLINVCRPSDLLGEDDNYSFGWCLCCKFPDYRFFTSRFLHVLLLRLAYTFPLAIDTFHHSQECNVWNNGISWENAEGLKTIVELIDNQRILVLVSHRTASRPLESSKHHSAVVRLILDLQQQICPNVETAEYLISNSQLTNWMTTGDIMCSDNYHDLFPIENVAKSMLLDEQYILSCTTTVLCTKDVLTGFGEPYYLLSPFTACDLMDDSKADELVPQSLLDEVRAICRLHVQPPQSYSSLKKQIDEISIFSSRDPMTIANLTSVMICQNASKVIRSKFDLSALPDGSLDVNSHLPCLMTALQPICDHNWFNLGLHLGVNSATLEVIEREQRGIVEDCKREMLVAWLHQNCEEPCTKLQLMSSLYYLIKYSKCNFEPRSIGMQRSTGKVQEKISTQERHKARTNSQVEEKNNASGNKLEHKRNDRPTISEKIPELSQHVEDMTAQDYVLKLSYETEQVFGTGISEVKQVEKTKETEEKPCMKEKKEATLEILQNEQVISTLEAKLAQQQKIATGIHCKTSEEESKSSNNDTGLLPQKPSIHHSGAIQNVHKQATPKRLKGVETYGETMFEVLADGLPQKLVWHDYGFYIEVPDGALPPGVTASVAVRVIRKGDFRFPENSELVSAVYWISCSEVFLKDVSVNIQHCAIISNEEETTKFKFIIANCAQDPPYMFLEKDGVFNADTKYATIQRKSFSFFGLIGYGTTKEYIIQKFYKHDQNSVFDATFRFVILANLKAIIRKYRAEMEPGWNPDVANDAHTVNFKGDSIALDIQTNPPLEVDNWRIIPLTPLKIYKADVDKYETTDGHVLHSCNIYLEWIGSQCLEDKSLLHRVAMFGTTESDSSITILYKLKCTDLAKDKQETSQPFRPKPKKLSLKWLIRELRDVTDWKQLGIQLSMKPATLDEVELNNHNIANRKSSMFDRWLKSDPKASWKQIVSALRAMDEKCLAKRIEERHCIVVKHACTAPANGQKKRSIQGSSSSKAHKRVVGVQIVPHTSQQIQHSARRTDLNRTSTHWICYLLLLVIAVMLVCFWFL